MEINYYPTVAHWAFMKMYVHTKTCTQMLMAVLFIEVTSVLRDMTNTLVVCVSTYK